MGDYRIHAAVAVCIVLVGRPLAVVAQLPDARPAVAVTPRGSGSCEQPVWARDGAAIAYARNWLKKRREFFIVRDFERQVEEPVPMGRSASAASAFRKRATGARTGVICPSFAWGPTSSPTTYAFACSIRGRFQLFWNGVPYNGRHGPPERVSSDRSLTAGEAAWGADGWNLAWVAVHPGGQNGQIWVMRDMMATAVPTLLYAQPDVAQLGPTWSRDGRSLAYYAHEGDTGETDLFVVTDVSRPRTTARQITRGPAIEKHPSWSPDGRRLAYFSIYRDGVGIKKEIRVVDAFHRHAEPYVVAENVRPNRGAGPAWAPDGKSIAYIEELKEGERLSRVRFVDAGRSGPRRNVWLDTKTVSNRDVSLGVRDGKWLLAFTAVDEDPAKERRWRRVYTFSLERLRARRAREKVNGRARRRKP